jgi:hypothetical protein
MTQEELELKELAELEELERLEKMESLEGPSIMDSEGTQPGQTHFRNPETGRTEPLPEEQQDKTIQPIDAVSQGLVAGLPKEVLSAGEAAIQAMEKGSLEDLGEDYANNRDEYIEAYQEAEKLHPGLTLGSDVVSALAGPGKIKLAAQAALGAASAGSRVKSDDPWEMAQQATMGGLLTLGFGAAGKKISDKIAAKQVQVGKHLGAVADETTLDLVDHGKNRKKLNDFIAKVFNRDGSKTRAKATEEFVQYTEKYKYNGTKLFEIGDSIDDTAYKSRQIMREVGEQKGELLKQYDRPLSKSEVKALYEQQKEELINIYSQDKLGLSEDTGHAVLKRLERDFYDVIEEESVHMTEKISDLADAGGNKIKTKVPEVVTTKTKKLKEFKLSDIERRKRRLDEIYYDKKQTATDISDKHYFKVTGQSNRKFLENAVPEMRGINKKYNVVREIAERSGEVASGKQGGVVNKVKNMLNLRTVFLASAAAGSGMGDVPKMAVLGIANKLVNYAQDPSLTAKTAQRLRTIGRHLQNDPGSSIIRRLAAYSHLPFEDFRNKVAGLAGEISLGEQAVARTADEAITRSDDILAAARGVDESLATELREILESGNEDAIGAFMDGLSKDPKLSKYFEPGLGFNGKVYDPQDKAMLEEQLRSNDDVSYSQKLQLIDDLNKNGTIPQLQPEKDDFLQYMSRNKQEPKF